MKNRVKLTRQQKAQILNASRSNVASNLKRLTVFMRRDRWLSKNNRYLSDTIHVLRRDLESLKKALKTTPPGVSHLNSMHLGQYMSASTVLHCMDGWSFLGKSLDSHMRNDSDITRHLAYYAELRAAMSLLSSVGIGIFSGQHFILKSSGDCEQLERSQKVKKRSQPVQTAVPPPTRVHRRRTKPDLVYSGTHEIIWLVLQYWAELPSSGSLVENIIRPGNISLENWLDAFGAGLSGHLVGSEWLRLWGLDLEALSEDHEARNEASYRPTKMRDMDFLDVPQCLEYLTEFWAIMEPFVPSRFETLDRYILRLSLERVYFVVTGLNAVDDPDGFAARVERMLTFIAPTGVSSDEWKRFLTRSIQPRDPLILLEASKITQITDPRHHLQVMSRALLLLRVATGSTAHLLKTVKINRSLLEFWWKPLGDRRGLWNQNSIPHEFTELWADIESALEDSRNWDTTVAAADKSFYLLWQSLANALCLLGTVERVALWGLEL